LILFAMLPPLPLALFVAGLGRLLPLLRCPGLSDAGVTVPGRELQGSHGALGPHPREPGKRFLALLWRYRLSLRFLVGQPARPGGREGGRSEVGRKSPLPL